jgi:hypothetical protein
LHLYLVCILNGDDEESVDVNHKMVVAGDEEDGI